MEVIAKTVGECWLKCIKKVLQQGKIWFDEDVKIIEILGLSVVIKNPCLKDPIIQKYGDPTVITHTLDKFKKNVVMANRPFTYADQIYNKNGVDQFEWLIERLTAKPETKAATICLLNEGSKDANLPCLTTIDFKIRDQKLFMNFFYRGQNILGRQYANFLALIKLQYDMAQRLNLNIGELRGYIASAHIYDYDLPYAIAISDNENITIRDLFYEKGPKSIRQNPTFKSQQIDQKQMQV